jgi:hypothetical protein
VQAGGELILGRLSLPAHAQHRSLDSHLLPGAFSQLPSVHTFGELSNFLRNGIADEDSRILSDSMQQLRCMPRAWWPACA